MSNTPPNGGAPQVTPGELDKANSTKMMTIGCKLPNGLIMELGKVGEEHYRQIRLKGTNDAAIVGGYGLTQVSEEAWTTWYKKNKGLKFVRDGFVFAHGTEADAKDHAKDNAAMRTGFEPLDPNKGLASAPGVEVDADHFKTARQDVANFRGGRAA